MAGEASACLPHNSATACRTPHLHHTALALGRLQVNAHGICVSLRGTWVGWRAAHEKTDVQGGWFCGGEGGGLLHTLHTASTAPR